MPALPGGAVMSAACTSCRGLRLHSPGLTANCRSQFAPCTTRKKERASCRVVPPSQARALTENSLCQFAPALHSARNQDGRSRPGPGLTANYSGQFAAKTQKCDNRKQDAEMQRQHQPPRVEIFASASLRRYWRWRRERTQQRQRSRWLSQPPDESTREEILRKIVAACPRLLKSIYRAGPFAQG